MKKMSTVELQIAERARKFKGEALHNLHHFIDAQMMQESYKKLNKKSAVGIDGKTWQQYGLEFPERCESLLEEFKSGRYRAPAIRRVYIPKDKHGQRPLGIAKLLSYYMSSQFVLGMFSDIPIKYLYKFWTFNVRGINNSEINCQFDGIMYFVLHELSILSKS